jgi:hypothetical protein
MSVLVRPLQAARPSVFGQGHNEHEADTKSKKFFNILPAPESAIASSTVRPLSGLTVAHPSLCLNS